jgi:hypothetical protein
MAGSTALHIAAWKNPARGMAPPWQFDFHLQLCNKGRDVLDYRNGRGLVPLHQAASVGNDRMFEALLAAGACAGIRRQSLPASVGMLFFCFPQYVKLSLLLTVDDFVSEVCHPC